MDRPIVYPGAIPLDTDLLNTNRNTMKALGMLAQAVLGSATVVSGLAVGPSAPTAMSVVVGPGSIFQLATVDATGYGSLPADTADALVKQGINITSTALTISAPATAGYSQIYLVEAALLEEDGTPTALPYYNASNPSAPYLGPGNSGTAQNTVRAQTVQLQAKAGVPATTGTQAAPGVDAGWVPLALVSVTYGQAAITAANIAIAPGCPIIPYTLPSLAPGFSNQAVFGSSGIFDWVVPPGVTRCRVRVWGGGGGGAGSTGTNAGGGGGGGGYAEMVVTGLTPGAAHTITVAPGGAGGASGGSNGQTAGNSGFDGLVVADGGQGGTVAAGGAPGSGTAGTILMTGGHGNGGGSPAIPTGGSAAMGGGGGGGSNGQGAAGGFPGGGGAGYGNGGSGAGMAGAGGLVIVEY